MRADDIVKVLRSTDARLVAGAIRFLTPELITEPSIQAEIEELVKHPSIEIRYLLATAMGTSSSPEVPRWLGELILSDPNDPWLRAAILSSAPKHADALLPLVIQKLPADETRATWVGHLVATILADKSEAGLARILKAIGGDAEGDANAWKLAAMADTLRVLRDRGTPLSQLLKSQNEELQLAFEAVHPTFERAQSLVNTVDGPLSQSLAAIAIAGELAEDLLCDTTRLNGLLTPQSPIELTSAAIARLTQIGQTSGIISAWPTLSPIARREAQALFVARNGTAQALLEAVAAGKIPVGDLDAATRNALNESKSDKVRELAGKVLAAVAPSTRGEVMAKYQTAVGLKGDDTHGRVLFEKKCATCHKHRDLGNEIGPQLVALKNKSGEFLLRAILDPNQAVESKYTGYVATTKDGRTFTGMIIDETATSLTLARTDGKKDTILRVDIEELRSTNKSFMPEGLEQDLSPQDLADLFQYVQGK